MPARERRRPAELADRRAVRLSGERTESHRRAADRAVQHGSQRWSYTTGRRRPDWVTVGNDREDLGRIELLHDGDDLRSEVEVTSRPWDPKWLAALAVALVVVVAAVWVRSDGAGRTDPPRDSSTTTSQPHGEAQADRAARTGSYLAGEPTEAIAAPPGTLVLLGSADRGWRLLDPSFGWVEELPALAGVDPELVIPVSGGLLVSDDRFSVPSRLELRRPGPDVERPVKEVAFEPDAFEGLSEFAGVLGAGNEVPGDLVWVIAAPRGPQRPAFQTSLVNTRGERFLGPFPLPAPPVVANTVGVIVAAGGRSFVVSADGTSDLGVGIVAAAAGTYAGRVVCAAELSCMQEIVDVATGQVVAASSFPSDAAARSAVTMAQAPDGSIATLSTRVGSRASVGAPTSELHVTWPDGRGMEMRIDNPRSAPVWLPGGNSLLILTGLGILKVEPADGALTATRVRNLNVEGATALFVLTDANR